MNSSTPCTAQNPDVWFRKTPPVAGAEVTIVCLPHAGGGASAFRDWRGQLPGNVEILAVQYPGHEGRWAEPLCRNVSDISGPLATAIAARSLPNLVLYGHSLGAFIAFEVARVLQRRGGLHPQHLFVSGSRAPDIAPSGELMHTAPEDVFLKRLRGLGGIPDEILGHAQLMNVLTPIMRCDFEIDEKYHSTSETPLDCAITAFVGAFDQDVPEQQADGWRLYTRRSFQLHVLPAGHWWPAACEAEILRVISAVLRDLVFAAPYR